MRITTIINRKDGVGKTATTQVPGTEPDNSNDKLLVIDHDAQGNWSAFCGLKEKECPTFYHYGMESDYAIMVKSAKSEAIQAAYDFGILIVYVDKLRKE